MTASSGWSATATKNQGLRHLHHCSAVIDNKEASEGLAQTKMGWVKSPPFATLGLVVLSLAEGLDEQLPLAVALKVYRHHTDVVVGVLTPWKWPPHDHGGRPLPNSTLQTGTNLARVLLGLTALRYPSPSHPFLACRLELAVWKYVPWSAPYAPCQGPRLHRRQPPPTSRF
ncbi:hypothetical protein GQ53DRAFT_56786 [Thozetella sp. PMI_491]|nr:hypothetical protein GQ53DRAFT_56786 [Thozetella sp. PMI_491]